MRRNLVKVPHSGFDPPLRATGSHRPEPPTVPFSFRIGLRPIGSRRRLNDDKHSLRAGKRCAEAHGAARFGRTPPGGLSADVSKRGAGVKWAGPKFWACRTSGFGGDSGLDGRAWAAGGDGGGLARPVRLGAPDGLPASPGPLSPRGAFCPFHHRGNRHPGLP